MIKDLFKLLTDFTQLFYAKGLLSLFVVLFFVAGLLYLILPGPTSINDIPPLPDSVRSELDGDTWQNPNIAAYFSDKIRSEITSFYWNFFSNFQYDFIQLPLLKINHPPEYAYNYIRDQQESTGLEEYYRPFRESLFVNIYEPFIYTQIRQLPMDFKTTHVGYNEVFYASKTTLRYYPSSVAARVSVYLGMWFVGYLLFRLYYAGLFRKS